MKAYIDIETAMQTLALILLLKEGKISSDEFQKAASLTDENFKLFEERIEQWKNKILQGVCIPRN